MKIIRAFPRKTKWTPVDDYAFVGNPPMIRPDADGVHISCTFTWDKEIAVTLARAWQQYYPIVKLGGPAFNSPVDGFLPGQYIKSGVTFTSRGCNNHCVYCMVPEREGRLYEYREFAPGYIIEDNNLLQCSHQHIERVVTMLRHQGQAAVFAGGLDTRLFSDWFVEQLRGLRIHELWFACDYDKAIDRLRIAVSKVQALGRNKLRCYVMIGKDETLQCATERLKAVWDIGCLPFAQLYQPSDRWIEYDNEWRNLRRLCSRPAGTGAFLCQREVTP